MTSFLFYDTKRDHHFIIEAEDDSEAVTKMDDEYEDRGDDSDDVNFCGMLSDVIDLIGDYRPDKS
jgi:hypothetical protein